MVDSRGGGGGGGGRDGEPERVSERVKLKGVLVLILAAADIGLALVIATASATATMYTNSMSSHPSKGIVGGTVRVNNRRTDAMLILTKSLLLNESSRRNSQSLLGQFGV